MCSSDLPACAPPSVPFRAPPACQGVLPTTPCTASHGDGLPACGGGAHGCAGGGGGGHGLGVSSSWLLHARARGWRAHKTSRCLCGHTNVCLRRGGIAARGLPGRVDVRATRGATTPPPLAQPPATPQASPPAPRTPCGRAQTHAAARPRAQCLRAPQAPTRPPPTHPYSRAHTHTHTHTPTHTTHLLFGARGATSLPAARHVPPIDGRATPAARAAHLFRAACQPYARQHNTRCAHRPSTPAQQLRSP